MDKLLNETNVQCTCCLIRHSGNDWQKTNDLEKQFSIRYMYQYDENEINLHAVLWPRPSSIWPSERDAECCGNPVHRFPNLVVHWPSWNTCPKLSPLPSKRVSDGHRVVILKKASCFVRLI